MQTGPDAKMVLITTRKLAREKHAYQLELLSRPDASARSKYHVIPFDFFFQYFCADSLALKY